MEPLDDLRVAMLRACAVSVVLWRVFVRHRERVQEVAHVTRGELANIRGVRRISGTLVDR